MGLQSRNWVKQLLHCSLDWPRKLCKRVQKAAGRPVYRQVAVLIPTLRKHCQDLLVVIIDDMDKSEFAWPPCNPFGSWTVSRSLDIHSSALVVGVHIYTWQVHSEILELTTSCNSGPKQLKLCVRYDRMWIRGSKDMIQWSEFMGGPWKLKQSNVRSDSSKTALSPWWFPSGNIA